MASQVAYAQKRRSTRLDQAVPVAVQGVGAYREPYQEQVSTLSISCHGCAYQSRYEVIQGEIVYLDIRSANNGASHISSKARVKWVQNLGNKVGFQVAVELEIAGNIWGVATPPEDWFPPRPLPPTEAGASGRELRVVSRTEQQSPAGQQLVASPASISVQVKTAPGTAPSKAAPATVTQADLARQAGAPGNGSQIKRSDVGGSPLSSLTQLMSGLGEQMQVIAADAAKTALAEQKSRMLDEFRIQLRQEAIKAMQSVILASKEDFTRSALKELSAAHESGARANYTRWMEKIGQDMESARQHMLTQVKDVSQRLDAAAATTVDRVQRNMEAARSEAVEKFVARLREQVSPMLTEAKDAMQALSDSQIALKKESQAIRAGIESQLQSTTNASLARVQEELEKNSAAMAAKTGDTLMKLSEDFELAAHEHAQSLLVSMESQVTSTLKDRTSEIFHEFSAVLDSHTRNYLNSISKAIADIPNNPPAPLQE